jgi:hypothetical protein
VDVFLRQRGRHSQKERVTEGMSGRFGARVQKPEGLFFRISRDSQAADRRREHEAPVFGHLQAAEERGNGIAASTPPAVGYESSMLETVDADRRAQASPRASGQLDGAESISFDGRDGARHGESKLRSRAKPGVVPRRLGHAEEVARGRLSGEFLR